MAKIVIIGPAHPLRGGLATFNERLALAFQEAGDEVLIETFSLQYPGFLFPGQTQYTSDSKPEHLKINVEINSVNPLSWLKVGNRLRREKPDIVLFRFWLPFMGPCFGSIARIIARNRHTRLVAITDNVIPHEKRPGDTAFTKYFLSALHGFITMSESVLKDLNKFVPDKPKRYNPHPLYDNFGEAIPKAAARKKLGIAAEDRVVLFFGFIRAYKGLDLMLKALADERLKMLNIKLLVAGEFYEDAAPYHQLIEELGIKDRLILATDFIPNNEVVNYFCAADLVVQPYKNATQSGVSQVAYHFNKPMVVTNVGGLAELIPDGKVGYVTDISPEAIAKAVADFYELNKETEFAANAAEVKKQFSWEQLVGNIKAVAKA
ncbi:MAG: glycosyltransferase [Sphingobacteriales bacterium]|nr:MAG: glycosyltransferase [Sphingobacteriales bacterium]